MPLGNVFIHLSTLTQYQVVTSDKRSGVLKAGKLFLLEFVQGIGGARTLNIEKLLAAVSGNLQPSAAPQLGQFGN